MLEKTNQQILRCLQRNSRMQLQEIGKIVHLTGQAVAIRIRNMKDEGIIEAFTVNLNPEKLGRPLYAFITVFMKDSADHLSFQHFLSDRDDVVESVSKKQNKTYFNLVREQTCPCFMTFTP